ncbi:MAG: tyrosine-type recombinase/integrase [Clostridiaceae bacterium]
MPEGVLFSSIFAKDIMGFINEQQALGYKFNKGTSQLKLFDRYVCSLSIQTPVLTKEIVIGWTEHISYQSKSTQLGRISTLRGLAGYMNRLGKSAYVYPRGMYAVDRYSYTPYIYSESEIAGIFKASDNYSVSRTSPYRHLILPLIIRMLYCCGLRISEATKLTIEDVNLSEGTLRIRTTKFGKERIIPMSDNLTKKCVDYRSRVLVRNADNAYFFPSPYGGHYDGHTIYKHFRQIIWEAGISHSGKGPRLHDFRHTFAVHCLKKWVLNGKDLTNCLPYLSIYLGHEDMRGTQHYLRLTADLYPDILQKVEESCSWMIPEVSADETD